MPARQSAPYWSGKPTLSTRCPASKRTHRPASAGVATHWETEHEAQGRVQSRDIVEKQLPAPIGVDLSPICGHDAVVHLDRGDTPGADGGASTVVDEGMHVLSAPVIIEKRLDHRPFGGGKSRTRGRSRDVTMLAPKRKKGDSRIAGEGMQANTSGMAPRDKHGGRQGAREDVASPTSHGWIGIVGRLGDLGPRVGDPGPGRRHERRKGFPFPAQLCGLVTHGLADRCGWRRRAPL